MLWWTFSKLFLLLLCHLSHVVSLSLSLFLSLDCLITVHDNSCKDQILDCNKFRLAKKPSHLALNTKERTLSPMLQVPPGKLKYSILFLFTSLKQTNTHKYLYICTFSCNQANFLRDIENLFIVSHALLQAASWILKSYDSLNSTFTWAQSK